MLRPVGALTALLGLMALATWYVPQTAYARRWVRLSLESFLDDLLQGDVQLDQIERLWLGGVVVKGVTVHDSQKRVVLRASRLELGLRLPAILHGRLRFTHGLLEHGAIHSYPSEQAAITLFDALSPTPSPKQVGKDDGGGLDVLFEHVHVRSVRVYGDVPGLQGIKVPALEARGDIRVLAGELRVRVTEVHATMVRPYDASVVIEQATFKLDTAPVRIWLRARISERDSHVRLGLTYALPPTPDERAKLLQKRERHPPKLLARDHLDLVLSLEPVLPELLETLRIAPAEVLLSPLRGYARLSGSVDDLAFRAGPLSTHAGVITVHGALPASGSTAVVIDSGPLELEKLVAYVPPLRLSTHIDVRAHEGKVSLHAKSAHVEVHGIDLRDADVSANYVGEKLSITQGRVRYGGGHLDVSGGIYSDGAISLRIRSQVPELARAKTIRDTGLRGGLRTDVRIERDEHRLAIEGSIGWVAPSYGGFGATKEMVIEGSASAGRDLSDLKVDAKGASWGTTFMDHPIGDFEYKIGGQYPNFTADFGLIDRRARTADAHLALTFEKNGDKRFLLFPLEVGVRDREPWRARADVLLERDGIDFRQVWLENGAQRLDISGRYSFSKAYRVDATLKSFDLGGLRELSGLDLADLDGVIAGALALTGTPGKPRIDAKGELTKGVFLGLTNLGASLSLKFLDGRFDVDSKLVLPDQSTINLYAGGEPGREGAFLAQLLAGSYQFGLDFEHVPFEVARAWLGWLGEEPPPGTVSATVRGAGSLRSPEIDLQAHVDGLQLESLPVLGLKLDVAHDGQRATLRELSASDPYGVIATLSGSLDARVEEFADALALRSSLATRPFEVDLNWKDRRLDQLPGPLAFDMALPTTGSVRLAQTEQGPALDVTSTLGVVGGTVSVDACGTQRHPRVELNVSERAGHTTGKLVIDLDDEQLAMADLTAETPLADWLSGSQELFLPRTSFTLDANAAATEEVPLLCDYVAGPIAVEVSALDAFANPPELNVQLRSSALQLVANASQRGRLGNLRDARSTGRPFALHATAGVDGPSFKFRANIDQGNDAHLTVDGSAPRAAFFADGSPESSWPLANANLSAQKVDLAPLLIALPVGLRASGQLDGAAHGLYGFAQDAVVLAGALSLSRGALTIGPLGQQLSGVEGRLSFINNLIRVEDLQMRDFDGRLNIGGDVAFTGLTQVDSTLQLKLKNFPIRRESAQVSKLTGTLNLTSSSTASWTRAELKVGDLRVNLPNDLGQGLQDLDDHPDILVRGHEPPPPDPHPHAFELRVLAKNPPFRVLRSDLSAEATCDLTIRYRAPIMTLQGGAEIERGNFEVYGKRFDLRTSRLDFDGSETIDPLLSIEATHQSGNDEIGVHVEGLASAPKITFTSSNPALSEQGAIIAQLLGARTTDAMTQSLDASGAAAGILAGATAGLLTQKVRSEFGGAIPSITVESNSQTLSSARIRAGVQLDQLIERRLGRLRKVVRGAYVEGFVSPGQNPNADNPTIAPQSRSGGLLELTFPKELVGTIEYRPTQNWRFDLAWEP